MHTHGRGTEPGSFFQGGGQRRKKSAAGAPEGFLKARIQAGQILLAAPFQGGSVPERICREPYMFLLLEEFRA